MLKLSKSLSCCDAIEDAIEERLAVIAETCPSVYANTFARLNHQKPRAVSTEQWECAVNDAGLFLDAWGAYAEAYGWTPPTYSVSPLASSGSSMACASKR